MIQKWMMLAAIVVASCVNAVTLNWQSAANAYHTTQGTSNQITSGQSGTFILVADLTSNVAVGGDTSSSKGNGTIVSFGDLNGGKYLRISTWGGKYHASFEGVTTTATTANPNATAGKAVIGISIVRSDGNFTTCDVSVNGQLIFQLTAPTTGLGDFWMFQYDVGANATGGSTDQDCFTNKDDIIYAMTDGYMSAADIFKAASVPEPTVLALLALGVAGLALKRRI